MTARGTPTVLGWDAFVQQSMTLEVAARDAPADAPFEVLDALPQSELPRVEDVQHNALMAAVLMPDALSVQEMTALAAEPSCDGPDARDMVHATMMYRDEEGHWCHSLWLVGLGTLRQHRDASGNVRVRMHWQGQEWPVLVVDRAVVGEAINALAGVLDRQAAGLGDMLRMQYAGALRLSDAHPGMMQELLTMAYATLMRARLGMSPGMRTPEHQALTRRMWARCIATVQARADAVVAHGAVVLPSVAHQVVPLFAPGRTDAAVRRLMQGALSIDVPSKVATAEGKARAAKVVVSPHMPARASEAMYGEIVDTSPTLWPLIGPEDDMQALYMEVLVQTLKGRNLMRLLGYVALVHERGGVELDGDELPKSLRCDVMELTGYSSSAASAAQRVEYRRIAHVVRHWMWMVEPHADGRRRPKRRPERVPLLVTTSLEAASDRAVRMAVNPLVLEGGRTMYVPRPLLAVTDEADADGSLRMLGVGIVSRLALSGADHGRLRKGESLVKALDRLALRGKLLDRYQERGAASAQQWLDGLLDRLRDIGHANLIGDTRVEWGTGRGWMTDAVLHYGSEQPGWMRKRPPALPPASVPSTPASTP